MNIKKTIPARMLCTAIAAGMLASSAMPVLAAVTLAGDADVNAAVEANDLLLVKNAVLGKQALSYQAFENADLSAELDVNAIDEVFLLRKLCEAPVIIDPPADGNNIHLSNSGISFEGVGMALTENNSIITISQPGEYNVFDSMDDGQIVVDVDKTAYPDGEVELILNGISLTCTDNSPIYVASIDGECAITAKNGTENTVSDGTSYTNADGDSGAIFGCDDLKFKGKGKLTVNGNCGDGIACKNDVKIWNGTLAVNAADDGIRGKDSVKIGDPDDTDYTNLSLTVTTKGGDGIKSTNTTDEGKGFIRVSGGTINVNSYADGFQSAFDTTINGGEITIKTYNGAGSTGGWGSTTTSDVSAKGIKTGDTDASVTGTLYINGGTLNIDSSDDSLHANGDINIAGGSMTMASGDDGVHSDAALNLSDGYINITKSYEGLEAVTLNITGGDTRLVASDDGINAAGGNDGSGNTGGGFWGPGGGMSSSTGTATISGGYLYVRAGGDGLDSNGNLTISGGTVFVCGPVRGGNGILDKGDGSYALTMSGGTFLGIGTSDMMETPTASNGKYLVAKNLSLQAGNTIAATDSDGKVIAIVKVPSDMSMTGAVQFYSANATDSTGLYSGGTYNGTLNSNGTATSGTLTGGSTISASSDGGGGGWTPWG